jgi:hypothetical protein
MRTNTCVSYLAKSSLALASASADGAADAVAFRGFASAALVGPRPPYTVTIDANGGRKHCREANGQFA